MDLRRGHDHGLLMHIYHKLGLWVPMAAGRVRGSLGPAEAAVQSQSGLSPADQDTAFGLYLTLELMASMARDSRPLGTKSSTTCWTHLYRPKWRETSFSLPGTLRV